MSRKTSEYRKHYVYPRDKRIEVDRRYREKNTLAARRRASVLQATPQWADKQRISEIYEFASLWSELPGIKATLGKHHVDHEIPLRNPLVCGLHTEYNLRVVPASVNFSKNNRYTP